MSGFRRLNIFWWGWMESNHLPSGYEPPALTDELQPHQETLNLLHYNVFISVEPYDPAEVV